MYIHTEGTSSQTHFLIACESGAGLLCRCVNLPPLARKPFQGFILSELRGFADETQKSSPGTFMVDWTAEDGSDVALNHTSMVGLFMAQSAHILTVHQKAKAAKAAIQVATT